MDPQTDTSAPVPADQPRAKAVSDADKSSPKIIYILYLLSTVLGVTGLIGVIMAYIYRDAAPDWLKSHYRFQIRTFWIGLLYALVGLLLLSVVVGALVLVFQLVWLIIRCIKGIQYLDRNEPHPDPGSWMFG